MKEFKSRVYIICLVVVSIIIQTTNNLVAQHNETPSYCGYFLKCSSAHRNYSQEEYVKSSDEYLSAFQSVPYIHQKYFKRAEKSANKGNHRELKSFLVSNRTKTFDKNLINKEYQSSINRLYKEDQLVRSNKFLNARDYIYKCTKSKDCDTTSQEYLKAIDLINKWNSTDSMVIADLLILIQKYGFPAERLVGLKEYNYATVFLLHYDTDQGNKVLQPILEEALIKGDIFPADYASIVDRRLAMYGKRPKYFEVPFGYDKLSELEKEEVDKERKLIGMSSIKDSRLIVQKKGRVIVYPLD